MEISEADLEDSPKVETKTKKYTKKMKNIPMNKPAYVPPVIVHQPIHYEKTPLELQKTLKSVAIRTLSMPAKFKAPVLQKNLTNSSFTNQYLDKYLSKIPYVNEHLMFAMTYFSLYLQSIANEECGVENKIGTNE